MLTVYKNEIYNALRYYVMCEFERAYQYMLVVSMISTSLPKNICAYASLQYNAIAISHL